MCKVCDSPLKLEIDNQILSGVSYYDISKWLLIRKVRISHMTLKRHHDAGHCGAKRNTPIEVISVETSPFQITIDENSENAQSQARAILKRIYIQQLQLVDQKQRDYTAGNGRYPASEIAGLKTILDCLSHVSNNADAIFEPPKTKNGTISETTLKEIREQIYGY